MDCGIEDAEMVGMIIPRSQWLAIHPDDGGILCANCMVARAKKLPNEICITGIITFADDYDEGGLQPYFALTKMLDDRTGGAEFKDLLGRTNSAEIMLHSLGYQLYTTKVGEMTVTQWGKKP